ncbi:hypothetical protein VTN00DRAFT_308 [Thermoascus crustaceus]|uniref:uncharacterized protein n=1 Tax=Thermoascus crustaceus TaxID=5088 RepID=UPI0037444A57
MDHDLAPPNPGRQSPDPERQPGAQEQETPARGRANHELEQRPHAPDQSQRESERVKQTVLESNPVHPLEAIEREKLK